MSNIKKISCGSIIVYSSKILICKPSFDSEKWNIPKGKMDDNETSYLTTAIRETKEECNIDITINKRIETIGLIPYLKHKDLYLFLVEIPSLPEIKCNSFYEKNGIQIPEMVDYKWIYVSEYKKYLGKRLKNVFSLIEERIINFINIGDKSES